ncbi:MAG: hypothetical protein V3U20_10655 [Thermoplasmata archaeon]
MRKYGFTFILVCAYALFSHLYFLLRYSKNWMEWDTSMMTKYAQAVQSQATIIPTGLVYPNGPGYSTMLSMLSDLSGLSVVTLQLFVLPIVGVLAVVFAYITFLELTNTRRIALLATFLLSLQPDFLFTSSRGTHEKFTYLLILMSMFFLSRSFSRRENIKEFVYYVLLFYISVLGMISFNFFFASTYILAVTLAFIIGYFISEMPQIGVSFKRMVYTSATTIVFFFSYMFYLYKPSRTLLYMFDTLADQIGVIALATEQHVTPQYTYIFNMWASFEVWLFLTLFNWVIAPLSLAAWIFLVYKFFKKKQRLASSMLLLLMFYTAFSIQLLLTIFADRFGVFNNLELRVFPVLMFFAVPLASISIIKIVEFKGFGEVQRKALKTAFALLFLVFVVNSLLKATNDPMVSNKWLFYSPQEKEGIVWVEHNSQEEKIWAGLDERLRTVFFTYSNIGNYDRTKFTSLGNARFWLISDIVEKRAQRIKRPLPDVVDKPIIYDSGHVKIYDTGGTK